MSTRKRSLLSPPHPLPTTYILISLEDGEEEAEEEGGGEEDGKGRAAENWMIQPYSVQFKMVSMRSEKPICAPPRLSEVPPTFHWSGSNDRLIDDGPLSSFQGRSSSASSFNTSLFSHVATRNILNALLIPLQSFQGENEINSLLWIRALLWCHKYSSPTVDSPGHQPPRKRSWMLRAIPEINIFSDLLHVAVADAHEYQWLFVLQKLNVRCSLSGPILPVYGAKDETVKV